MKIKKKNLKISLIGIVVLVFVVGSISYLTSQEDPEVAELAQCLTDNGAQMYGAFRCGACAEQKKLFGNTFKYINYIECDSRGDNPQSERCQIEGITGYPTWNIAGQTMTGVRDLNQLANIAGCEYGS